MKQHQPRETTPLWVWLTHALMGLGAVAYLSSYFMIDNLSARQ